MGLCYNKLYLRKDMENMGYLFEYCEVYMKRLYKVKYSIDIIKLTTDFMKSGCRHEMEIGHPTLLNQAAIDTLEVYIDVDCNRDYSIYKLAGKKPNYKYRQLYWIGWIYAYIHFRTEFPSREIVKILSVKRMLSEYVCGHQLSEEGYYDRIKHVFE